MYLGIWSKMEPMQENIFANLVEIGMLKLDLDKIDKKTVWFLLSLQKPYWVRIGNRGINLRKDCQGCPQTNDCYECWVYTQHDDKNRLKINITQKYKSLPNNVLWDIKRGKPKPYDWVCIDTEQEADRFLRWFTGFY